MVTSKLIVTAGVVTLIQSLLQTVIAGLSVAQYFCAIDFLKELPLLLFIKILYYHNPEACGSQVNIGQSIDGITNQAFVLINREPLTVTRTFYINCIYLGLGFLWTLSSALLMTSGSSNGDSRPIKWPWTIVTIGVCASDLVAAVIFINDSFYTRTLSAIMDYIGATASGVGNTVIDTKWAAWLMVLLYSKFVIILFLNVLLVILVSIWKMKQKQNQDVSTAEIASTCPLPIPRTPERSLRSVDNIPDFRTLHNAEVQTSPASSESKSESSEVPCQIPRAKYHRSFKFADALLRRYSTFRRNSLRDSPNESPERSPQPQRSEAKRQVNFPVGLLSLPKKLETMIAEKQRQLDKAVIDTSGKREAVDPQTSQFNASTEELIPSRALGRRGTAVELQGQLPWAYIPASTRPMREQLPPDEELPPVPLPDYTAMPTRKASVHRAPSSIGSLTQRKDYASPATRHKSPLKQSDVLY